MKSRITIAVASALLTLSTAAAPSPGARSTSSSSISPVFLSAHSLTPPRGGASRAPRGYLPLHPREFARMKAAANARVGLHTGGAALGTGASGPIVSSYENVSPSFNGDYENGVTPPDTTGAIGPDRYIEAINLQYAIYDRSGSLLNGGSLSSLTGIPTGLFGYALSDPQMMWDAKTQRFYYAAVYYDSLLLSDNGIAVGWSKTARPSSASDFCQYAVSFGSELPDYPKLGDSSDFLLFGYNQFGSFASTYDGSALAALNKPPAGSTCPPTSAFAVYGSGVLHNLDGSEAATPVPANLVDDANGAGYVVANADLSTTPSADFVSVYTVTTSGTNANGIPIPTISGPANVPVPSYSMPANAPQQGSSDLLDTLDGRFEAAVAAVDPGHASTIALWTAHAVYGGAGAEERWYEIDPSAGSLLQSGSASSGSLFIWNGAVSPDRANTGSSAAFGDSMAMSVSTSSASSYPAIQFVWKKGTSPQSALTNLVQSSGPNIDLSCTPCRWGDYSGASPDPAATGGVGKIWLANQYNLANGTTSSTAWRTWVFAVTPTSPTPPATLSFFTDPQTLIAGRPSTAMQLSVSPAQQNDLSVTVSSSSPQGQFAISTSGPWSASLQLTIPASQATSPSFYYRDTKAGSATLTAEGAGTPTASQTETVGAAAPAAIMVSPGTATVTAGATQAFAATGTDQYGNPVSVSSATWSTNLSGATLSPATGSSTTFTAGSAAGSGTVTAMLGGIAGSASVTVTGVTAAPSNLVASPQGRHITLSWRGSGAGVTYNLYRGTSPGAESPIPYATGLSGTTVNDQAVASGTTYYYKLTAVGPGGESAPSNEARAKAR
jgi:hypothetical protein